MKSKFALIAKKVLDRCVPKNRANVSRRSAAHARLNMAGSEGSDGESNIEQHY